MHLLLPNLCSLFHHHHVLTQGAGAAAESRGAQTVLHRAAGELSEPRALPDSSPAVRWRTVSQGAGVAAEGRGVQTVLQRTAVELSEPCALPDDSPAGGEPTEQTCTRLGIVMSMIMMSPSLCTSSPSPRSSHFGSRLNGGIRCLFILLCL